MISLHSPWALVLLAPVALLFWQDRLTGRTKLVLPGPDSYEAGWTVRRALSGLPRLLQVLGLALCVVALARPQLTRQRTLIKSEGLDIMLAVDTSGSMRAEDMSVSGRPTNRLAVAKAVLDAFIEQRAYDRVGVVVFGEEAFTHVPLTLDHATLRAVLGTVQIGVAGENRTAIGTAIAVGSKRLKDLEAPEKILILLTDGQSNAGRFNPLEAAELAAAVGVKVYTIGIGDSSPRGGLRALLGGGGDGVDEPTLKAVAERTGGQYFRARDARTLEEVYATINELQPSPAEVEEIAEHIELYRQSLVPGAGLLALALLLSSTWLRRGP